MANTLRAELNAERVRLREGSDDHFYGAWTGPRKSQGGHARLAGEAIRSKWEEYQQLGGADIVTATPAQQQAAYDNIQEQIANGPPGMEDDLGVEFTSGAAGYGIEDKLGLGDRTDGDTDVLLAHLSLGGEVNEVAGALAFERRSFNHQPVFFVPVMGSMGILDGTGSALVRTLIMRAAGSGRGIVLAPIPEAESFWKRMGMHPLEAIGGDDKVLWGMTGEETLAAAKVLRAP